ncbi:MAG: beta-propeller domain-containing protein [Planctomycetota bacterium]
MAVSCAVLLTAAAVHAAQAANAQPKPVKSFLQLVKLLAQKQPQYLFGGSGATAGATTTLGPNTPTTATPGGGGGTTPTNGSGTASGSGTTSFSGTNVQVAGVDESDIVKTDGTYIYQVNNERVLVIKAQPDNALAVTSVLSFESEFSPYELFVDGSQLVVIGSSYRTTPVEAGIFIWPSTVKAIVIDVSDAANCKVVRELEMDGDYISSRRIGHCVYLVARKYPDYYAVPLLLPGAKVGGGVATGVPVSGAANGGTLAGGAAPAGVARTAKAPVRRNVGLLPAVKDTAKSRRPHRMAIRDVLYFPYFNEPDYLLVAGFDLSDATKALQVKALLGAGEAVYASAAHLYVADSQFLPLVFAPTPMLMGAAAVAKDAPTQLSNLYRFDVAGGAVSFGASGQVPGMVINQFSMDENNGYFRVATTTYGWVTSNGNNGLYVLDGSMKTVGRLEGLAPGEQIYATRFIDDRCYMVTYHLTDPLFVISVADPTAPAVLGQLNIPGFSNYLHPYDANHILGFGKNAVNGFYQGMKIACFDVTDVNNPVQVSAVSIGDRGTDSEVLYDHRALLFDKDKALLAFPISIAVIQNKTPDMPLWTYGDTVFDGAYVYNFTLENGFVLRKALTHQSGDLAATYDWGKSIQRLLYIDTSLYSLSNSLVKVNDLGTLEEKETLVLPP